MELEINPREVMAARPRPAAVFEALDASDASVANLAERLATLFDRLQPILHLGAPDSPERSMDSPVCGSQVADRILVQGGRIEALTRAVADIHDRLTV